MSHSAALEQLSAALGPKGFSTDPQVLAPHLEEWRGRWRGETVCLLTPHTVQEVQTIVRICADAGLPITPQGGNTGLVGGQIPAGEVLLSLKRLNRLRNLDPLDDSLVVEAGVTLQQAQEAASGANRLFPLALASQGTATIGGLISTNAGGVHVVRYGMMRDLVLGLEVVLPNGELWAGLSSLRKDNTGYDLKHLFIGAEGTLGIITAATLKLFPRSAEHLVAIAGYSDPAHGLELLHAAKATGALAAFEIMNRQAIDLAVKNIPGMRDPLADRHPWLALIEWEGRALAEMAEPLLAQALENGLIADATLAQNAAQAAQFWALRESLSAAHRKQGAQTNHDISVPVAAVPQFLAQAEDAARALDPAVRLVAFGHAGDGNIHYTALQGADADGENFPRQKLSDSIHQCAIALGGSISAEHGIGVARRDELLAFEPPEAIAMMRAIKAALDPRGILNPRAMLGA